MELQTSKLNLITALESVTSNYDIRHAPQRISHLPLPGKLLPQDMSLPALANRCMNEIESFRRGEPSDDQYSRELFRRALTQGDPLAWEAVQQCFNDMVLGWIRNHPMREVASRFDSEENYIAQTFARCWLLPASNQKIEFMTLAAGLLYLRASLNGTILDTLRAYSQPQEMLLPDPGKAGEPLVEDRDDSRELWEIIRNLIPNERQQRVAYLLFHCNLKPREIVHFCQEDFTKVEEIYRLRHNIFERLLQNADYIRWRTTH